PRKATKRLDGWSLSKRRSSFRNRASPSCGRKPKSCARFSLRRTAPRVKRERATRVDIRRIAVSRCADQSPNQLPDYQITQLPNSRFLFAGRIPRDQDLLGVAVGVFGVNLQPTFERVAA